MLSLKVDLSSRFISFLQKSENAVNFLLCWFTTYLNYILHWRSQQMPEMRSLSSHLGSPIAHGCRIRNNHHVLRAPGSLCLPPPLLEANPTQCQRRSWRARFQGSRVEFDWWDPAKYKRIDMNHLFMEIEQRLLCTSCSNA